MDNIDEYKSIFYEILNGVSSVLHSSFNQIFVKHLSYVELAQFDIKYNLYLDEAKKQGILTFKEKEKEIIKDGLWKENDEIDLEINQKIIQDLSINYSKDYLYSRRKRIKQEIESFQNKISSLKLKKAFFIGQVAEDFANNKTLYYRIVNSFFKDKNCSDLLIKNDDIEDEYEELQKLYYKIQDKLSQDNIKKISLFPFFLNIYSLCQDNVYSFYGRPIIELSNYQVDLASYGRYFKHILSERQDIPKDVLNDPNQIMEWLDINENAKKAGIIGDEETSDGSKSIVGGTAEDLKYLGIKTQERFSLRKELDKRGGKMGAEDLFQLTK